MKLNYLPRLLFATSTPPTGGGAPSAEDVKRMEELAILLNKSKSIIPILLKDSNAFYETLRKWNKELLEADGGFISLSQTLRSVVNDFGGVNKLSQDVTKSFTKLESLANKLKYDQKGINELSLSQLKNVEKELEIERDKLVETKKLLDAKYKVNDLTDKEFERLIELNGLFDDQGKLTKDTGNYLANILQLTQDRIEKEQLLNKNLGISGALLKTATGYLSKLGVSSEVLDNMEKKLRKIAEVNKVTVKNVLDTLRDGMKEALEDPVTKFTVGLSLVKSGWNGLVGLFKKGFEIAKEFDATIVESARSIGMSKQQMMAMTEETRHSGYTLKQTTKAIADMNEQLGLSVDLGAANTKEFAAMTNQMGLAVDEASNIQKLGILTNTDLRDTNKIIADTIVSKQKESGLVLNSRQIYKEIGKLSAGILVNFKQNPGKIAEAVIEAKKLGTSLEDINKMGESMLNFESSIQSQMEAELLTGKSLNLEKARYAALTGDQLTLEKEIASQVGSLADYQKLNVIAQKSLAQAFGMSREEMAKMLQQQEVYAKLGDVSKKSAAEQLKYAKENHISLSESVLSNLQQQTATEQIAAAWDSIQQSIAALLQGPLGTVVDIIKWISENTWAAYTAFAAIALINIGKLVTGIVMMGQSLFGSQFAAKQTEKSLERQTAALAAQIPIVTELAAVSALRAEASMTAALAEQIIADTLTAGIGTPAIIAEDATIAAGLGVASSSIGNVLSDMPKFATGGIVTSEINNATVGEAGPEAIIPLNSPRANNILGNGGNNQDTAMLVSALADLRSSIHKVADRPVNIQVDGQTLANTVAKNVPTSYGNLLNPSSRVYGG